MRVHPLQMASGSCQFIALASQLGGTDHATVRRDVVAELRAYPNVYCEFVRGPYAAYLSAMALPATWGDNVTLQAAAELYDVIIDVATDFANHPTIRIQPVAYTADDPPLRVLRLRFAVEYHYVSGW